MPLPRVEEQAELGVEKRKGLISEKPSSSSTSDSSLKSRKSASKSSTSKIRDLRDLGEECFPDLGFFKFGQR